MATGSFILRPSADISVNHGKRAGENTVTDQAGYLLINEEVCDEDATYLTDNGGNNVHIEGVAAQGGAIYSTTSSFILSGNIPDINFHATGIKLMLGGYSAGAKTTDIALSIGDANITTMYNGSLLDISNDLLLDEINKSSRVGTSKSFPNTSISITTYMQEYMSKSTPMYTYAKFSQVYVEIEYVEDAGIRKNLDGEWKFPFEIYKKNNGIWSAITPIDARSYILSKIVVDKCNMRGGHNSIAMPEVAATCMSVGLTNGKRCSCCGKITKEYDVVEKDYNNHVGTSTYTYSAKEATCTTDGNNEYTICGDVWWSMNGSGCGQPITEKIVYPATGHNFVNGVCTVCGTAQS